MASNILFNSVEIGDHATFSAASFLPDTTISLPRAQGIRQRDMGGGEMTITVKAWIVKTTPPLLAQYIEGLMRSFGTGLASLVADGVTYTNCKSLSVSPENKYNEGERVDYITCVFRKSAMTQ